MKNMEKESVIEFQKIDCNCNDCLFMDRDIPRFKQSLTDHHRWQLNYFNTIRENLYLKSIDWLERGFPEKSKALKIEADKMKFQFNRKECYINYGSCTKFKKAVSFIPNVCQLDTQKCFNHRKEAKKT